MFPVYLPGPILTLREFNADDLEATCAIVCDDQVTASLSFDTKTPVAAQEYLAGAMTRAQKEPRPDYYLAIMETETREAVGFVRLGLGGHQAADLGYAIRFDRWGRGYATEASRMMLNFGFGQLGLHRISAACSPDNVVSQRVVQHFGMQPEGRIRDHVFTSAAWRDSLTYSILEHEWTVADADRYRRRQSGV